MESFWPTLPKPSEAFVAEVASVMRKVCVCDEDRRCAICYLLVRVMRPHDAVNISYEDRFDLKRAKFAMTASGEVISR